MSWTYVIIAMIFLFIGFLLCSLLSANKCNKELTIEEIIEYEEMEVEDE